MQFHSTNFRRAVLASIVVLTAFATPAVAQTYDFRVLHVFGAAIYPNSTVQFDSAGNLYGTTELGGATNGGVIYKIANDGARTESTLHSFDPIGPQNSTVGTQGVVIDSSTGDIYGTTQYGGDLTCCLGDSSIGVGQLYKLAPDGTFTVLLAFNGNRDGMFPGPVIRDPQGNLYGVLQAGADSGRPTLFRYAPDGTFTVLHVFRNLLGFSMSPLIRDRAGNLYGTFSTYDGNRCGAIYKLSRDGTFTTLYSFTGGADECFPNSLSGDQAGNLYGTATASGQGGTAKVVFKFAPDGTFTVLHTFTSDGAPPHTWSLNPVLPVDGNLYGTADYVREGTLGNYGTLYEIAPDGGYARLFDFGEGRFPTSGLTLQHGRLYGTAFGASFGQFTEVYSYGVDPQ